MIRVPVLWLRPAKARTLMTTGRAAMGGFPNGLQNTCLHESGHVLVALALKMRAYSVQLVTERDGDTGCAGYFSMVPHDPAEPEPSTERFCPDDSFVLNMIAILFGGLAAEMRAPSGTKDFSGARSDFRRIIR
jgi:ATP-dependent Zn protease